MKITLFGGEHGWRADDWTASDDRVRGGSSQSYMKCSPKKAVFTGNLDIKTLGGAGFASQRTADDNKTWDLSKYDGLLVVIDADDSDKKKYTFILKDELAVKDPVNGRLQSTVSWEFDLALSDLQKSTRSDDLTIFIPWLSFSPTYRGKPTKRDEKLQLTTIRSLSIMMRSFFGTQEGDFKLTLLSIGAEKDHKASDDEAKDYPQQDVDDASDGTSMKADSIKGAQYKGTSVWRWMLGRCGRL